MTARTLAILISGTVIFLFGSAIGIISRPIVLKFIALYGGILIIGGILFVGSDRWPERKFLGIIGFLLFVGWGALAIYIGLISKA